MEYPIYIKSTNDYIMYKYRVSGTLEISAVDYDFKQQYIGYGRQQAVRMFRQALKELKEV